MSSESLYVFATNTDCLTRPLMFTEVVRNFSLTRIVTSVHQRVLHTLDSVVIKSAADVSHSSSGDADDDKCSDLLLKIVSATLTRSCEEALIVETMK